MGSKAISTSCPRGGRPLVEDAASLRVSDLRSRWGWLRTLEIDAPDGSVVRLRVEVDDGDLFGWVFVGHQRPGQSWEAITYHVALIARPARLGGHSWWFRCPDLGVPTRTLYLPAAASSFGSRQAHGLAHRSQRQRAPARAAARVSRISAELGGSGPDAAPTRPRGMWSSTFARRSAALAQAVEAAAAT